MPQKERIIVMKLEKIGVQLYTIRDFFGTEEEAKRSFEKLKKLGYDEAQTAGCYGNASRVR